MADNSAASSDKRIAMLIDGENAQPSLIGKIVAETAKYGTISVRRIYGDWSSASMKSWVNALQTHAIRQVQQSQNTVGKNSTDIALIIDAMDILHEGNIGGFCLVSSDSDFTGLAMRIRESGLFVMGIGRKEAAPALVNACDIFVYTENLQSDEKRPEHTDRPVIQEAGLLPLLRQALDMSMQDNGWAHLGQVGNNLLKLDSAFDCRTYECKQLSQLFKKYPDAFELKEQKSKNGPSIIYVRHKDDGEH